MSDSINYLLSKINELVQLDSNFKIYKIFKDKGYIFNQIIYLCDQILEDSIKAKSFYENHIIYKYFINTNFIFNIKTKIDKLDKAIGFSGNSKVKPDKIKRFKHIFILLGETIFSIRKLILRKLLFAK